LIDPASLFRIGKAPQMVEILPHISGVDFNDAWARRIEEVIDERSGLKAFVISAEDLIVNKLGLGRLQDLADADAVAKAQRLRLGNKEPG
jgi:hypothetical protein